MSAVDRLQTITLRLQMVLSFGSYHLTNHYESSVLMRFRDLVEV